MVEKKTVKKVAVKEKKAEGKVKSSISPVSSGEKEIGRVSGWFSHVNVAAIKLSGPVKVGDKIHIKGHTTDLEEKISSMQIENKPVKEAKKGDHIGIKVKDKVRPNDAVLLMK